MQIGFLNKSYYEKQIAGMKKTIEAYQSGSAYQALEKRLNAALRQVDQLQNKLKKAEADYDKKIEKMESLWIEAMEDVRLECEKQLAAKDRELKAMEEKVRNSEEKAQEAIDAKRKALELYKREQSAHMETTDQLNGLTARLNKNFRNSSKSSGTDPNHKTIKNSRVSSGRKPGAQENHEHHSRRQLEASEVIKLTPPQEYLDPGKYKPTGHTIRKQLIRVHLAVEVTDYIADEYRNLETGARVHAEFPMGLKDDVTYDSSVKAAAYLLNHHCHASIDRTISFLEELSHGQLKLSKGFVNQLSREFSRKTQKERDEIFLRLALADVLHVDFTFSRACGKTATISVNCSDNDVLYQARPCKGNEGVKGTPAEVNRNTIVSDHEACLRKLGSKHQECISHVFRYLLGAIENEPDREWAREMHACFTKMNDYKKTLGKEDPLDTVIVGELEAELMKSIQKGWEEYENVPPTEYYREGINLLKRVSDSVEDYTLFLHDKRVPSNNNAAERNGREYKRASHASMGYRSIKAHSDFCDGLSMLKTHALRGDNLFDYVEACFAEETV